MPGCLDEGYGLLVVGGGLVLVIFAPGLIKNSEQEKGMRITGVL